MVVDFLADLAPYSVDPLGDESRRHRRSPALIVLGECLTRQALMRAHPEAAAKARAALLASLDSPDWFTRQWAADGLSVVRNAPEVRAKLQEVAQDDPYVSPREPSTEGKSRFPVRDTANDALAGKHRGRSEDDLSYVMRTAEGECRVQRANETPVGEALIGPVPDAQHQMCTHYNPSAKDPFLCWQTYPRSICTR